MSAEVPKIVVALSNPKFKFGTPPIGTPPIGTNAELNMDVLQSQLVKVTANI